MHFAAPWVWLIALPLLAYLFWFARRSYAQLSPAARWSSLALRTLIVLLLLAALARPAWRIGSVADHVVFLLDASQSISVENIEAGVQQIDTLAREAFKAMSNTRVSLAAFGQSTALLLRAADKWDGLPPETREKLIYASSLTALYAERNRHVSAGEAAPTLEKLDQRIKAVETFRDQTAGNFTDIDRALRLALNLGSAEQRRTVYLLTDGNFNRGQLQSALTSATTANARIHAILLDRPAPPEVAVADIAVPANVRVNQGFSADVRIASAIQTTADLRIFKDNVLHQEQKIDLKPGENALRLSGLNFREKGFHAVEVSVKPARDTQIVNNRGRALVVVPGEARVLYIDRDVEQIPYLKSALELEGMQVEARSSAGVPQSLSELLSFDAMILCNVSADRLTQRQMQTIRTYVQDFGGGFLMIGGDESFGLGGYYNTPIEEILPVRMPIQKDLLRPSLALMLVIDKSGSMDGAKLQLAKRAAIATAEVINPRDLIGVVGFDSEAQVILGLTPAGDQGSIQSAVAQIETGGGTFLYPAMVEAHESLNMSNARRKHVIVLSDGQTQGYGYDDLAGSMAVDGITISTVGIGEGADMNLMEGIARAAGGRAYFTNDFSSIPQIFTREALRASRSMLVERLFQPQTVLEDPALADIATDELPVLTGYVATTPRPQAPPIIVSDSGDPIFAKWRYGLGRTAAFTSEPKPRWAEDWIEWEDYAVFWSQLVRSLTSQSRVDARYIEAAHRLDADDAILSADIRDARGDYAQNISVELAAAMADGRTVIVPTALAGPGLYEARFPFKYGVDQQFVWRVSDTSRASSSKLEPAAPQQSPATAIPQFPATAAAIHESSVAARPPSSAAPAPAEDQQTSAYGFVHAFSPEFATLGASVEALALITQHSAGTIASVGNAKFEPSAAAVHRALALWPYLLAAALLLAPLDIFIRRMG